MIVLNTLLVLGKRKMTPNKDYKMSKSVKRMLMSTHGERHNDIKKLMILAELKEKEARNAKLSRNQNQGDE